MSNQPTKDWCVNSVRQKHVGNDNIVPTEGFELGPSLAAVYPLLDLVFAYLTVDDLNCCRNVCKDWRVRCDFILQKCNEVGWFITHETPNKSPYCVDAKLRGVNTNLGLIVATYSELLLKSLICVHRNSTTCEKVMTLSEYFEQEFLPKRPDYLIIVVSEVSLSLFNNMETMHGQSHLFQGLLLPEIKNIRQVMFDVNVTKSISTIREHVSNYIGTSDKIESMLVFISISFYHIPSCVYNLLECLAPDKNHYSVPICGSIVLDVNTFNRSKNTYKVLSSQDLSCVAFVSNVEKQADFQAYSCVINGRFVTLDQIYETLLKFKSKITLKKHCTGIRASSTYPSSRLTEEFKIIADLFPNIPFLTIKADGLIGWNSYPQAVQIDDFQESNRSFPPDKSRVFLIMTWN